MARALTLMVENLPLYADAHELVGALATGERGQACLRLAFTRPGFPLPNMIFGGLYYVPAVIAYFEAYEGSRSAVVTVPGGTDGANTWKSPKADRRASRSASGRTA